MSRNEFYREAVIKFYKNAKSKNDKSSIEFGESFFDAAETVLRVVPPDEINPDDDSMVGFEKINFMDELQSPATTELPLEIERKIRALDSPHLREFLDQYGDIISYPVPFNPMESLNLQLLKAVWALYPLKRIQIPNKFKGFDLSENSKLHNTLDLTFTLNGNFSKAHAIQEFGRIIDQYRSFSLKESRIADRTLKEESFFSALKAWDMYSPQVFGYKKTGKEVFPNETVHPQKNRLEVWQDKADFAVNNIEELIKYFDRPSNS